ncbi:hypothetical protein [Crassaminicella profunda]|uniref:DUF7922 domain-containing protein n=1 Tax=Crassaminicella profunda TaxID=1286698 RepID=UPI001CA7A01B|nr:hypothetical protein [Crassaminicella profunda]QZY55356.1 hypothetical protein K7H06_20565 [Crassaminicella profunda]
MDKKRYRRYFIILDPEDDGFENKQGKKSKGYAKIETKNGKGVLSEYIQNMKYFDDAEYIYRGYLIGTKQGKQIYADNGTFMIDKNGKGELIWKFDPENVDGQGNTIRDFNVIAIVAESSEQRDKGRAAPLVGFIDKKRVDWKHVLQKECTRKERLEEKIRTTEQLNEKKLKIKVVEKKEESYVKGLKEGATEVVVEKENMEEKHVENTNKEKEIEEGHGTSLQEEMKEAVVEKENFEVKDVASIEKEVEVESTEALKEEVVEKEERPETEPIKENIEGQKEVKVKREEFTEGYRCKGEKDHYEHIDYGGMKYYDCKNPYQYYHQYFKMVCGYVENILKYHKEVEPFEKNIDQCKWWKIDASQQTLYRNFLPFYGYVTNMYSCPPYRNYAGCPAQIYKYKHYNFGIKRDKKNEPVYYLYGIPGRFMLSEQPYEGMTGFVYWHPIEDKKPEKGDYGYWILHIDAKTGKVAIPLKPTIPPR